MLSRKEAMQFAFNTHVSYEVIANSFDSTLNFLIERQLLKTIDFCLACGSQYSVMKRKDQKTDGYHLRCSNQQCKKSRSLREYSFFSLFPKVTLQELVLIIFQFFANFNFCANNAHKKLISLWSHITLKKLLNLFTMNWEWCCFVFGLIDQDLIL